MKSIKKLSAVLVAVLLCAMLLAPTAVFAENTGVTYTPIDVTNPVTFNKYLTMKTTATVPAVTFSFTVAAGTPIEKTDTTFAVLAGPVITSGEGEVTSPSIADVTFASSDATTAGLPTDAEGSATANQKYATQTATVSFDGITFPEPGIYRYVVTETASTAPGITNDPVTTRTLDVYVTNSTAANAGAGDLEVAGVVLRNNDASGTAAAAPGLGTDNGTSDINDKSAGYTNSYMSSDLTVEKNVAGNQASRDKYFKITVVLEEAPAGIVYTVDLGDAEASPVQTAATTYSSMTNPTSITIGDDGKATAEFYLKDTQSVKIQGIGPDVKFTVSEAAEDYKSSVEGETTANDFGTADRTVTFTNTRDGFIPTGVMLTVVPGMAIVAIALFGLVALRRKKSKA